MSNQYNILCEQICQKLGWKFQKVQDGVIVIEGDTFITLSDTAISLLAKVRELEEVNGELKVDKAYLVKKVDNLKNTIKEYRISCARSDNSLIGEARNAVKEPIKEIHGVVKPKQTKEWDCTSHL